MTSMKTWAGTWIAMIPAAAMAQINLSGLDRDMAAPRSQALVLGTVHFRDLPKDFNPDALNGLLDRLAAFKPDIITVEDLPGEACDQARRQAALNPLLALCPKTEAAQAATGLDLPAAIAAVDQTLKTWPAQPSPAQRRHLAALLLAASAGPSAYVQWLQLPADERHEGDGLDATLVAQLTSMGTRRNESLQLAARLAARLGLQRLHAIDDHTGDNVQVEDEQAFGRDLVAAWASSGAVLDKLQAQMKPLQAAPDLLPLYRALNSPAYQQTLAEGNVRPAMAWKSAGHYPQQWVAGWEIRNLRMAANIRETFRERPGARVLTVVGAAHKPWLEQALGQMQGVSVVDVEAVLR